MKRSKFKIGKLIPAINTASLPDIIFMLLFFFMVTTVLREVDLLVEFTLPTATVTSRLEERSLVDHIYIGPPVIKELVDAPMMQLNDQFARLEDIGPWVDEKVSRRIEPERSHIIQALKVDQGTPMKIVTGVKQELRKSNALKINYSTAGD